MVLFFADKIIVDLKVFFIKCIGYVCPIFHKIGNARGINPLKIRGAKGVHVEGKNTLETG